jgi:hypothetical protein
VLASERWSNSKDGGAGATDNSQARARNNSQAVAVDDSRAGEGQRAGGGLSVCDAVVLSPVRKQFASILLTADNWTAC